MLSTFFQVGQAQDDEYVFNRDHESRATLREDIEKRWDRCRVLCGDQHFLDLAKQNFNGATWQIFLQSEILYRGHKVVPTAGDEPDINVELKGRRCWIEATAAGTGANHVPKLQSGTVNPDQIKLRLTSKIYDKEFGEQYKRWVENQTIRHDDFYVIAINGSAVPNADIAGGPVNVMEQCLFGLGRFGWKIAVPSGEVLSANHTFQENIAKNGIEGLVEIGNNFFLRPEMAHVSAIIYSAMHIVNSYDRYGRRHLGDP